MTPEERASEILERGYADPLSTDSASDLCEDITDAIRDAVREAVEAERERCAKVLDDLGHEGLANRVREGAR